MSTYTIRYFDFPGGRGEECRLALHVAGADFRDDRIAGPSWADLKARTPFGSLPVLEVEGKGELAQSNVILRYLGKAHGLHPADAWTAAQHEALMGAVEDLRAHIAPVLRIKDDTREAARREFADGPLQRWAANVERRIEGPFVAGATLHVVDLKLYVALKWFFGGGIDHMSRDDFAAFPKLGALHDAVDSHARVRDWYAR